MKLAFKIMSLFWMLSPLIFCVMRFVGIFDFPADWAVALLLAGISTVAMFFNYKGSDE